MTEPFSQKSTELSETDSSPLLLAGLVILAIIFAPFLVVLGIAIAISAFSKE